LKTYREFLILGECSFDPREAACWGYSTDGVRERAAFVSPPAWSYLLSVALPLMEAGPELLLGPGLRLA